MLIYLAEGELSVMDDDKNKEDKPQEKAKSEAEENLTNTPEESDVEPASQPDETKSETAASNKGFKKFWRKYLARKKVTFPITAIVIILIILAIPISRYKVLGLFLKQQYSIKVVDTTTGNPVTRADINLAGETAQTDNQGEATVRVKIGDNKLTVTKKYYSDFTETVRVPLFKNNEPHQVKMAATGRQVPISVVNKITGKALENATVKAGDSEVKTDAQGQAIIVLPPDQATIEAVASADNYNEAKIKITVTEQKNDKNSFGLTPSGKIYFLSKASGKIDVVKTNLDGSDRQTVLKGTGNEEDGNTILLASRDWKYLALLSRRDSDLAKLYLIDTSSDKLTTIDGGDATFELVGWKDHRFIYVVYRNKVKNWQPKAASIKSFNAENGQLLVLDNTDAHGSNINNAKWESYTSSRFIYILGDNLIFTKNWYSGSGYLSAAGRKDSLISINPDGSNRKTISSLNAAHYFYGNILQYEPNELIVETTNSNSYDDTYYELDRDGNYKKSTEVEDIDLQKSYPTYLLSPSGKSLFWYEERDGKNSLFTSNTDGSGKATIGNLTNYKTYGWYTDNYLLVSKNSSELYIIGNGPIGSHKPLKISDYHKPQQSFFGYGGGYGGL